MPLNQDTFYDLSITSEALDSDEGLYTAYQVSLLTWGRADEADPVPDPTHLKGWWGDSIPDVPGDKFGSKLWLLIGAKATPENLELGRQYALEAVQWAIDDGIVAENTCEVEMLDAPSGKVLAGRILVRRPSSAAITFAVPWEISLGG